MFPAEELEVLKLDLQSRSAEAPTPAKWGHCSCWQSSLPGSLPAAFLQDPSLRSSSEHSAGSSVALSQLSKITSAT